MLGRSVNTPPLLHFSTVASYSRQRIPRRKEKRKQATKRCKGGKKRSTTDESLVSMNPADAASSKILLTPVRVIPGAALSPRIIINTHICFPSKELPSLVLKLAEIAWCYYAQKITNAMVFVPSSFTRKQQMELQAVCEFASLRVVRMLNSSSNVAYERRNTSDGVENKMVIQHRGWSEALGIGNGIIEIKATEGNIDLSGIPPPQKNINICFQFDSCGQLTWEAESH